MSEPVLDLIKASGWSGCGDRKATQRQPHLFYRAGEVDDLVDALKAQHAFEMRRAKALEDFYLKELDRLS